MVNDEIQNEKLTIQHSPNFVKTDAMILNNRSISKPNLTEELCVYLDRSFNSPLKRELGRRRTGLSVNTRAFVSEHRKVT